MGPATPRDEGARSDESGTLDLTVGGEIEQPRVPKSEADETRAKARSG